MTSQYSESDLASMTDAQLFATCVRLSKRHQMMEVWFDELDNEKAKLLRHRDMLTERIARMEAASGAGTGEKLPQSKPPKLLSQSTPGANTSVRPSSAELEVSSDSNSVSEKVSFAGSASKSTPLSIPEELLVCETANGTLRLTWFYDEVILEQVASKHHPLKQLSFEVRQQSEGTNGRLRTRVHPCECRLFQGGEEVREQSFDVEACIPNRVYSFSVRACAEIDGQAGIVYSPYSDVIKSGTSNHSTSSSILGLAKRGQASIPEEPHLSQLRDNMSKLPPMSHPALGQVVKRHDTTSATESKRNGKAEPKLSVEDILSDTLAPQTKKPETDPDTAELKLQRDAVGLRLEDAWKRAQNEDQSQRVPALAALPSRPPSLQTSGMDQVDKWMNKILSRGPLKPLTPQSGDTPFPLLSECAPLDTGASDLITPPVGPHSSNMLPLPASDESHINLASMDGLGPTVTSIRPLVQGDRRVGRGRSPLRPIVESTIQLSNPRVTPRDSGQNASMDMTMSIPSQRLTSDTMGLPMKSQTFVVQTTSEVFATGVAEKTPSTTVGGTVPRSASFNVVADRGTGYAPMPSHPRVTSSQVSTLQFGSSPSALVRANLPANSNSLSRQQGPPLPYGMGSHLNIGLDNSPFHRNDVSPPLGTTTLHTLPPPQRCAPAARSSPNTNTFGETGVGNSLGSSVGMQCVLKVLASDNKWEDLAFSTSDDLESQAMKFLHSKGLKVAFLSGMIAKMRSMINTGQTQGSVDIVDLI